MNKQEQSQLREALEQLLINSMNTDSNGNFPDDWYVCTIAGDVDLWLSLFEPLGMTAPEKKHE